MPEGTRMDIKEIARELAQLIYRLDREPGNRVLILQRASELEAMIDGIPYRVKGGQTWI
jgi:hypothetical protein